MPDPIDNIMNYLRDTGSVDPNRQTQRRSRMKQDKRRAGVQRGPQRHQGRRNLDNLDKEPRDEFSEQLQDIGEQRLRRERGKEGEIDVDPGDMTPRIIDQLNEAILSHKIAIHREDDEERTRQLEQAANNLRQQIKQLGGEPIYADESVEEGLQKLRGMGQIGADRIKEEIQRMQSEARGRATEQAGQVADQQTGQMQDQIRQQVQQMQDPQQFQDVQLHDTQPQVEETAEPDPVDETFRQVGVTREDQAPIREIAEQMGARVDWDPDTRQVTVEGPEGARTVSPDEIQDGRAFVTGDRLDAVLRSTMGIEEPVAPAEVPEEDPFRDILRQVGADPEDVETPVREVAEAAGADVEWDPETEQITISGPEDDVTFRTDVIRDGRAYAHRDRMERILETAGVIEPPTPAEEFDPEVEEISEGMDFAEPGYLTQAPMDDYVPPEPTVDENFFNEMAQQYGLEPRSREEIQEHARAIVERQAQDKKQPIKRELDRFKREWPEEFQQAKENIQSVTQEMQADVQEEMSARGMFYSSIMANSLTELDQQAQEEIAEISRDAANQVAELRADLRDIEQWAVLEEEVVRREMMAEERQRRERLANMHMEVARWADQMRLDQWYKEAQLAMEDRRMRTQEVQAERDWMVQQGEMSGVASLVHHPSVEQELREMGMSKEDLMEMNVAQRASTVNSLIDFMEFDSQKKQREIENALMIADHELNQLETIAGLQFREKELEIREEEVENYSRQLDIQEQQIQDAADATAQFGPEQFELAMWMEQELGMIGQAVQEQMEEYDDPADADFSGAVNRLDILSQYAQAQLPQDVASPIRQSVATIKQDINEAQSPQIDPELRRQSGNKAVDATETSREMTGAIFNLDEVEQPLRREHFTREGYDVEYEPPEDDLGFVNGDEVGETITEPRQIGYFDTREFASPDTGEVKVSTDLITRLNQLREDLGVPIHVTSGYRTPEYNEQIGGADQSRHITGEAADIVAEGISPEELADAAEEYFPGIGIYEDGHVHVDVGPEREWRG